MTLPLDQMRTARPPTEWTSDRVRERLVEAFAIERRMPGQRFAAIASAWPATPIAEFHDVLHWTDARERVWESWARAKGVFSYEISRMEQSLDWLLWIDGDERKWLVAWAAISASGKSVRAMLDKRKISRTTFYRTIDRAAQRIADRLNELGTQVR